MSGMLQRSPSGAGGRCVGFVERDKHVMGFCFVCYGAYRSGKARVGAVIRILLKIFFYLFD